MIVGAIPAYVSAVDYIPPAFGFVFWLSSLFFIDWLEKRSGK